METNYCSKMIQIIPLKNVYEIKFEYYIEPTSLEGKKSRPTHYLSHIIGHEGKGSLYEKLASEN